MRRRLALAALVVPVLALANLHGCGSDEPEIENLCGWLSDPDNCYRKFFADVDGRCGVVGKGNAPVGGFLARDKLDICVLSAGGQVLFDPPLNVATFPLASTSFKFVGADGTSCGAGSWGGPYTFSIHVDPYPPDAGTPPAPVDAGPIGEPITGGTFSSTNAETREVFDVSCPSGDTHHFDRLQTTKCPEYTSVLPRAELESSAGAVNVKGFVRFRVYFPPAEGALENATPVVVEYFDCSIPGAPEPCADQAQDGTETDVDCGGICAGCQEGQGCIENADCASGNCAVNMMGFKKCAPGAGTGGAGGSGGSPAAGGGGAGGTGG